MWRYAIGLAAFGMITAQMLNYSLPENDPSGETPHVPDATVQTSPPPKLEQASRVQEDFSGRTARIRMDARGHFVTNARMNGRTVEVLVDTGATSVAINRSTARRLGIHLNASDFKYTVSTANGKTKAAAAFIDRIEIGRVGVRNVRAAVLDDNALSGTLLGMTFLGELRGFEIRNRELVLTQ